MFSSTSRYFYLKTITLTTADRRIIAYTERRFLPALNGVIVAEHVVTQDERLDNITTFYLGDPEQFWRVCDVNTAMRPDDLTAEVGRRVNISSPLGG